MITSTQRIQLHKLVLTDAPFILELLNEPGWLKFIGDRGVKNLQGAEDYITTGPQKSYLDHGFGLFKVSLKDDTPIGLCGLLKRDYLDHPDIGFALLEIHTGKGYAQEAAMATMDFAQKLNVKKVLGFTDPENIRSINLLEKIGMHFDSTMQLPGDETELSLYSI